MKRYKVKGWAMRSTDYEVIVEAESEDAAILKAHDLLDDDGFEQFENVGSETHEMAIDQYAEELPDVG